MAKYSKKSQQKVERAMHEMKRGKLKSGRSGKTVKNPRQAIAIGLSEARESGAKVPKKGAAKKSAKKSGGRKKAVKKSTGRTSARSGGAAKKTGRTVKRSAAGKRGTPKKRGRKRRSR